MNNSTLNKIGWFLTFVLVSNSTTVMPFYFGSFYYLIIIGIVLYLIFKDGFHVSYSMLMLLAVSIVSIVLNDIPSFFRPWQRLVFFFLLTMAVGPSLVSPKAEKLKVDVFQKLFWFFPIVIIWSLVLFVLGRGSGAGGYFQGILVHSMIMGPVAGLTVLYCFFQFQVKKNRTIFQKVFYILLMAASFLCLLQAGSRSAVIGTILAMLVLLFVRDEKKLSNLIKNNFWFVLAIGLTVPLWTQYLDKLEAKNQDDSGLNLDSREVLWEQRLEEWKSSPIYGIGFSAVDASAEEGSTFDEESGKVETGNSWLCCLSMTGILGFLVVVFIFGSAFVSVWRLSRTVPLVSGLLLGVLTFFMAHMMAEGYIFAGGSFLNTILWLTLGVMITVGKNEELAIELEERLTR